ncbi:AraC family transcriptional regulator [Pseudoalteromonas aurantia]|uniref:AraC family transcriptional regulator n=1 Tax=Pseudoalteromonas aurantia 208 TaxID=1314867 RepID=A0ABR9EJ22_9GAMM|nr:GyrI-like domain-containing protein [Pseudoalteromonas aurantia]MBE0370991.1 AraC family transcriptional regulator [Pseudoalteromonas aurantia 208]
MKAITRNHYQQRLLSVIDYMYDNINKDLDVNTLADRACMSAYHFHRIYREFAGEPVNVTVRRMRLQKASVMLLRSDMSQAEIAAKVQYGSVAAFNRAFSKHYGQTPDVYRKLRSTPLVDHSAFYPLSKKEYPFMFNIQQHTTPEIMLIGLEHHGDYMKIGQAFEKLTVIAGAHNLINEATRFFGLYYDDPKSVEQSQLTSLACISIAPDEAEQLGSQLKVVTVPAGNCVSLLFKGDYAELEKPYDWLFGQWLPQSGLELVDFPPFEEYLNDLKDTAPVDLLTNINCLVR